MWIRCLIILHNLTLKFEAQLSVDNNNEDEYMINIGAGHEDLNLTHSNLLSEIEEDTDETEEVQIRYQQNSRWTR